jgi:hypothetical protein
MQHSIELRRRASLEHGRLDQADEQILLWSADDRRQLEPIYMGFISKLYCNGSSGCDQNNVAHTCLCVGSRGELHLLSTLLGLMVCSSSAQLVLARG